MLVTTVNELPGKKVEVIGLVMGNTIKAKHIGKDLVAGLRNIVGGEIKEYTEALSEAREQALERMLQEAKKLGADAVVGVRFTTSAVMAGAAGPLGQFLKSFPTCGIKPML